MSKVKRYDMRVSLGGLESYESPCGDYVDYEDYAALEVKCAALAAENAGMKKFCKDAAFDADYEAELGMERGGFSDALNEIKTPATDAFLAEVRAQGVDMAACALDNVNQFNYANMLDDLAQKIRKGVQS